MLILSRKVDEIICIGDDILLKVIEVRGQQVRLGIAAPVTVGVHRQEVYERIQQDKNNHNAEHKASRIQLAAG